MSAEMISVIQSSLFGFTGSFLLIGLCIMIFFIIAFLIIGIPFKYSVMFTSPLALGFVSVGWFPQIVATIFWILIAGIGIFLLWSQISDR
jgi:uncharacterized RDD family membrane protein YckC